MNTELELKKIRDILRQLEIRKKELEKKQQQIKDKGGNPQDLSNTTNNIDIDKHNKIERIDHLLNEGRPIPNNSNQRLESVIENLENKTIQQDINKTFIQLVKGLSKTSKDIIQFQKKYKDKGTWSQSVLKRELGSSYEHKLFILSLLWEDNTIENKNAFVYREDGMYFFFDWLRMIQRFMRSNYKITEYTRNHHVTVQELHLEFIKYLQTKNKIAWSKEIKKQVFVKYLIKLGYNKKRLDKGYVITNIKHV